jgi:hypothetical protein
MFIHFSGARAGDSRPNQQSGGIDLRARLDTPGTNEPIAGSFVSLASTESSMAEDTEIAWHKEQIAKNRTILEELEAGNTAGGELFPETQSEIEHLKAQIAQSELIVAADNKDHPEAP